MVRRRKVPYVRCECGFRKTNGRGRRLIIEAGDHCPRCGDELTEYNELHRQSMARAGGSTRGEPGDGGHGRGSVLEAASLALGLIVVYGAMRALAAAGRRSGAALTVEGEAVPLFDPAMVHMAFVIVMVAALAVFIIPRLGDRP